MSNFLKLNSQYKTNIKYRLFDLLFSAGAILLFMPIILIIGLVLKIYCPKGNIFFKQERLGLGGKAFYVYKFRTMIVNAEYELIKLMEKDFHLKNEYKEFRKLRNDPRIIPKIGYFLRASSLDELPQFFNVFLGQMSIVGPRPYIKNEFDIYPTTLELNTILSVKPGMTGYWQIIPNRHSSTFKSRVLTDMEYIKKKNFKLDLEIITKTVSMIVLQKEV